MLFFCWRCAIVVPMNTNRVVQIHPDAQLIEQLGGSAAVARRLGYECPAGTRRVNNWKLRGIPPRVLLDHREALNPLPADFGPSKSEAA